MPILKYKSFNLLYRVISKTIELIPIPEWVTISTRYGILIMPKGFRMITTKLDLVEPEIQNWLKNSLKYARTFIDVGAAYGYYTLKASKLISGQVFAFEPDPILYKVLEANLAINRVRNAKVSNMALSDTECEIDFSGSKVKARKLDQVLTEEGSKLTEDDIVKIDVEGMALSVLRGAIDTLRASKPKLVIELHPGEEAVEQFLEKLGYRILKPSKYFIIAE